MASKRTRPVGIAIIGWINIVAGGVFTLAGFAPLETGLGPLLVLMGVVSIVFGVGLLRLQRWARVTGIILYVLNVAGGLAQKNPIAAVVAALLIAYLLSPKVREAFSPEEADSGVDFVPTTHECPVQH